MFYAEEKGLRGWSPVTFASRPETITKGGVTRLKSLTGHQPRLRGEPVEIGRGHENLTLAQLREVYSPDGKFRATGGRDG